MEHKYLVKLDRGTYRLYWYYLENKKKVLINTGITLENKTGWKKTRLDPKAKNARKINSDIVTFERRVDSGITLLSDNGTPMSKDALLSAIKYISGESSGVGVAYDLEAKDYFHQVCNSFKGENGTPMSKSLKMAYERAISLLLCYKKELVWADFNASLRNDLFAYLSGEKEGDLPLPKRGMKKPDRSDGERGFKLNTSKLYMSKIARGIRQAIKDGYPVNPEILENWYVEGEETTQIAFTKQELREMRDLPLKNRLKESRDMLLVGCLSGLRASDFLKIKSERDFAEKWGRKVIHSINKKTGAEVVVPVHPWVLDMLYEYNFNLPDVTYKEIWTDIPEIVKQLPSMHIKTKKVYSVGRRKVEKLVPRYTLVGVHTGRRTFATHLYLDRGHMTEKELMDLTGHTDWSMYMRYIRLDKEESAAKAFGTEFFNMN